MRVLFGCLAVLLGAVSITLAARYGFKGTDTVIDGVISAVVFGAIALCAFLLGDSAAQRTPDSSTQGLHVRPAGQQW